MRLLLPLLLILPLLAACPEPDPDPAEPTPVGCGDGVVASPEACDDGAGNSDTAADACRTDCSEPRCGDGATDTGETCDDGERWGGDGCSPTCAEETGRLEVEPNDTLAEAETLASGESVTGSTPPEDRDCFAIEVLARGWVSADVTAEASGGCPDEAVLRLFSPDGELVASGTPGRAGACSPIDPLQSPGARFALAGTHRLCVEGLLGRPVPSYVLTAEVGDDTCDLEGLEVGPGEDIDGDGFGFGCDLDDDGDGVDDTEDNCPTVPNGPTNPAWTVDGDGFIRRWILLGPLAREVKEPRCLPSDWELPGGDATATAEIGDEEEGVVWTAFHAAGSRIRFLDVMAGPTPREVYALAWVRSETEREVTAALGPDDGARLWVGEDVIIEESGCQGTNVDQFQGPVTLQAGWNRVLVKVRDQGGGWGMYFRFRDEAGPVTDLELSLEDGPWSQNQSDRDGDGLGDICDPTPAGDPAPPE